MKSLNPKKFGLALGFTGAFFYAGCMLLMLIAGRELTIKFFNSLMHGLDVSKVIRMDVPTWEALVGIGLIFIICWLFGACLAWIYNLSTKKISEHE